MGSMLKDAKIIFLDELVQSIRTKRALILIVSYLFLMFAGIKVGSLFEALSWAFASSRQSFSIVLPFYISAIILPLFAVVISYNSISEETSQGSIKFMACRTDRFSIMAGKALSSLVLSSSIILIAYVMALFYIRLKVGLWFFLPYAISWAYMSLYALCFICLAMLVSTISKTTSSSLVWAVMAVVAFLVMLSFDYIKFISPFYFANNALDFIIKGMPLEMLLGVFALALHSVVYFTISLAALKKADL